MKLLGNLILLRKVKETKKKALIILPGQNNDPYITGEVIAIGPGIKDKNNILLDNTVKQSDIVMHHSSAGFHIKLNKGEYDLGDKKVTLDEDEDFIIISEKDIIVIVSDDTITPLSNMVCVEKKEKKKKSSIIILKQDEPIYTSKVLSVGPGFLTENNVLLPMTVKANDTVLHLEKSGWKIEFNDKEYIVINEKDIIAIIEEDN